LNWFLCRFHAFSKPIKAFEIHSLSIKELRNHDPQLLLFFFFKSFPN
jgi:hypothetical protein